MQLIEGQPAPNFELMDKDGILHTLESLKDDYVVLFFYPKDNTPGCTIEAKEFSRDLENLRDAGATVVGISGGDEASKTKFCKQHKLKVLLLSDSDYSVSKAYGTYGEKSFMGKKFNGIFRKTYVLNQKREVIKIFDKVKPLPHSKEVVEFLRDLKR